jgi:hypothetical protein
VEGGRSRRRNKNGAVVAEFTGRFLSFAGASGAKPDRVFPAGRLIFLAEGHFSQVKHDVRRDCSVHRAFGVAVRLRNSLDGVSDLR